MPQSCFVRAVVLDDILKCQQGLPIAYDGQASRHDETR